MLVNSCIRDLHNIGVRMSRKLSAAEQWDTEEMQLAGSGEQLS